MLEKISRLVMLKDFYGPLLTQKQQDILNLHYENDWSLSEIADQMHTSRQAVFDMVKRAQAQLELFEDRLGAMEKFQMTRRCLLEVTNRLERSGLKDDEVEKAIQSLRGLIDLL